MKKFSNEIYDVSFKKYSFNSGDISSENISVCDFINALSLARDYSYCVDVLYQEVDIINPQTGEIYCTIKNGDRVYFSDEAAELIEDIAIKAELV